MKEDMPVDCNNGLEELRKEFRMSDYRYDPWSCCLGMHFAICDVLRDVGEDIPSSWGYSPGLGGPDTEDFGFQTLKEGLEGILWNTQDLESFGNILSRYASKLRVAGKNY